MKKKIKGLERFFKLFETYYIFSKQHYISHFFCFAFSIFWVTLFFITLLSFFEYVVTIKWYYLPTILIGAVLVTIVIQIYITKMSTFLKSPNGYFEPNIELSIKVKKNGPKYFYRFTITLLLVYSLMLNIVFYVSFAFRKPLRTLYHAIIPWGGDDVFVAIFLTMVALVPCVISYFRILKISQHKAKKAHIILKQYEETDYCHSFYSEALVVYEVNSVFPVVSPYYKNFNIKAVLISHNDVSFSSLPNILHKVTFITVWINEHKFSEDPNYKDLCMLQLENLRDIRLPKYAVLYPSRRMFVELGFMEKHSDDSSSVNLMEVLMDNGVVALEDSSLEIWKNNGVLGTLMNIKKNTNYYSIAFQIKEHPKCDEITKSIISRWETTIILNLSSIITYDTSIDYMRSLYDNMEKLSSSSSNHGDIFNSEIIFSQEESVLVKEVCQLEIPPLVDHQNLKEIYNVIRNKILGHRSPDFSIGKRMQHAFTRATFLLLALKMETDNISAERD